MIEAKNLSKSFEDIKALDSISATIRDGNVFGLIGTNGAGKSTFLKILAGILKPESGEILIDNESVFENINAKEKFFYISDEQYFFANTNAKEMMKFYSSVYKNFDTLKCEKLLAALDLGINRKINTFSKGMKKQLCICDHVGLLHKGGILLSKDVSDMKLNIHKIQCVFESDFDMERLKSLDIMQMKNSGRVYTITLKGEEEEVRAKMEEFHPVFFEIMDLSLEEIFISETEVYGYDIKKLIF